MVQDHGKANERLKQIAQERGAKPQQELPPDVRRSIVKIQRINRLTPGAGGIIHSLPC
jgi:hypothetical protein